MKTELIHCSEKHYLKINNKIARNKYLRNEIIYRILYSVGIYRNYFFILTNDNQTIGALVIRSRISRKSLKRFWWIYGVIINEDFRGKGFGVDIMNKAINWLKDKRVNEVLLYVDKDNKKAISLYLGLGFKILRNSKYHKLQSQQFLMAKEITR